MGTVTPRLPTKMDLSIMPNQTYSNFAQCTMCPASFRNMLELNLHCTTQHSFSCKLCAYMFYNAEQLNEHVLRVHCESGSLNNVEVPSQSPSYSPQNVEKVKPLQKEKGNYTCDICEIKLANPHSLKRHIKTVHNKSQSTENECKTCGKCFLYPYALREHSLSHSNERRVSCNSCGFMFKRAYDLTKHLRRAEVEQKCEVCDTKFECKAGLQKHKLQGHGVTILPNNQPSKVQPFSERSVESDQKEEIQSRASEKEQLILNTDTESNNFSSIPRRKEDSMQAKSIHTEIINCLSEIEIIMEGINKTIAN